MAKKSSGTQKIKSGDVVVKGVKEVNAALRTVGPELRKEFKKSTKQIATHVAGEAKGIALGLGGVAGHVAPSIGAVAGSTQDATGAGVRFGGAAYPMAQGAEFGAYRYKQFKPWRGNGSDAGYFVYPAIRKNVDYIYTEFEAARDRLVNGNPLGE